MTAEAKTDVAVIGGGPGGLSAALWCQRLGLSTTLLSPSLGGQLLGQGHRIVDYLGIPEARGPELAEKMASHCLDMGVSHWSALATAISPHDGVVELEGGDQLSARAIVLATGATDRTLGLPNEQRLRGKGIGRRVSLDGANLAGCDVAVVGGGDTAFENALALAELGCSVTLLHRSKRFRAREQFSAPVFSHPRVRVWTCSELVELLGDECLEGLRVRHDGALKQLKVSGLFIRVGVCARAELLEGHSACSDSGYVMVDARQRTRVLRVWACGDVCEEQAPSIAAATGAGMRAAKDIELTLKGTEPLAQAQWQR